MATEASGVAGGEEPGVEEPGGILGSEGGEVGGGQEESRGANSLLTGEIFRYHLDFTFKIYFRHIT